MATRNFDRLCFVILCAAEHDSQWDLAALPANCGDNQTGKSRCWTWGMQDPMRDRALDTDPSRSSRSSHMGQRCQWFQPRSILQWGGPLGQPSGGMDPVWPRDPHLHRAKPRYPTGQAYARDHAAALLFYLSPALSTRSNGSDAPLPATRRTNHLSTFGWSHDWWRSRVLNFHQIKCQSSMCGRTKILHSSDQKYHPLLH